MEQKGGGGVRPLVWVLIALNAVVLLALAWLALSAVNQVREVESRVESLTDAIGNIEGGDRLLDWVDDNDFSTADIEARLDALEGRAGDGASAPSQPADLSDIEARLDALETQPDAPSSEPDGEASLGNGGDLTLQVFPELQFDGTMSDGCLNEISGYILRYEEDRQRGRIMRQQIEGFRSVPFSMMHDKAFGQLHEWIDRIARSRGWRDWNAGFEDYETYERSDDEMGTGPSAPVPCIAEKKQMTRFHIIRASNPMGEFRNGVLDFHWECAYYIETGGSGPDFEHYKYYGFTDGSHSDPEVFLQLCKTHNERYAQWLPPLPELSR